MSGVLWEIKETLYSMSYNKVYFIVT